MAEEAPKTVGTGPALGKDFGEHVMDVGKKEEVLALARFKEGMAHKMPPLTNPYIFYLVNCRYDRYIIEDNNTQLLQSLLIQLFNGKTQLHLDTLCQPHQSCYCSLMSCASPLVLAAYTFSFHLGAAPSQEL